MNYIPLNIKTHYELLSSLIRPNELCDFLIEKNINTFAVTDSNMFGTMELFNICSKNNIKVIIGVPIELDNYSMILYAKSYTGYVNLLNIVSYRNLNKLNLEFLISHTSDLICVTSDLENFNKYKEMYELVYIKYSNDEEKNNALVITNNIVYMKETLCINESDQIYLPYLYMIKNGQTIDEINNYKFIDVFIDKDINKEDCLTTYKFAELIDIKMPKYDFDLPEYSKDKVNLLTSLCEKGLNKRLNGLVSSMYKERLKKELDVIISMNFADYFLIVYDFILYAKKNGIVIGPGRGSAAGSLVSYSLGITEIDPLKYDLSFERFLNKDRVTLPDIDTDIEYLRRDEVINYVKEKYGYDKVANIITFGTLLPKQVIRDVARVLKIDKFDELIKLINDKDTFDTLLKNNAFITCVNNNSKLKELIKISIKLEGLKRHTSIHAAGVIISSKPLMNKVPLYVSSNNILSGYTMEYLENLGLLKMDFLALKNLTIIDNIVKMVKKDKGLNFDINKIPLDDKKTLNIFYNVDTTGVFQFESEGMRSFLKILKVKSFDDLVLAIAMYRPGSRDNIPELINVREGKRKINYLLPELEPILKSTYGIIIYQEQIIEILKAIGGFSYSKADIIRRAMSKKKENVILEYQNEFIEGANKKGYDREKAEEIYKLVLKFANYGFNKSHSVAYAFVAYQIAFLKAYFREYFMLVLLNNTIGSETKTKEYIDEAKINGISIEGVNINISTEYYLLHEKKIVLPLTIIKGIGGVAVTSILEERKKGSFIDFSDFVRRVYGSKVNIKIIENLILSGALDTFGLNRKTMINNLKSVINYATLCESLDETMVLKPEIIEDVEYDNNEIINKEYELFGFYVKNHPVSRFKRDNTCLLKDIEKYFDKNIIVIGMIDNIREVNTKNNDKMAFVTISDEYAKASLVMFPTTYLKYNYIKKGDVIKIIGKVEKRMSNWQIVCSNLEKL